VDEYCQIRKLIGKFREHLCGTCRRSLSVQSVLAYYRGITKMVISYFVGTGCPNIYVIDVNV
jgi:hypothetical protein